MKDITAKAIADAICWTALTVTLVWAGFMVAAAMVGSFGIIYISKCVVSLYRLNKYTKRRDEYLKRTNLDDDLPNHIDDE